MKKYSGYILITDMDGTLLNGDKEISPENKRAILEFVEQGGKFSVATGRSPASAGRWLTQLPINSPCVFYNGSMVRDMEKEQVLNCAYLDRECLLPCIRGILEDSPSTVVEIFTDQGVFVVSDPARKDPYLEEEHDPYIQSTLEQVQEQEWIKILLCDTHDTLEKTEKQLADENLTDICNCFYSQDFFFEITPKNHSKGTALHWIRKACLKEDIKIIAAGDYDNDETMIKEADFGVAVGNAHERLKAMADYITVDNNHHPIADILKIIGEKRV